MTPGSLIDCNKALKYSKSDKAIYYLRGRNYEELDKPKLAYHDFEKAIKIDSLYADAYHSRAAYYYQEGIIDKAIKDCNKAIEINSTEGEYLIHRAWCHVKNGAFEKAINDLEVAIVLDSLSPIAFYQYGKLLSDIGRHNQAITCYSKAIKLDNEAIQYIQLRALSYVENENFDKALEDFNKVLSIDPDLYHFRWVMSTKMLAKNRVEFIERQRDYMVAIAPVHMIRFQIESLLHWYYKEYNECIRSNERIIDLDSSLQDPYLAIGAIHMLNYEEQKAQEIYSIINRINPCYKSLLGEAYAKQKLMNYKKAIKLYKKALNIRPNDPEIYYSLAQVYALCNNTKKACEALKLAAKYGGEYYEKALSECK